MASDFNDQQALQSLFQESFSPITNYGQGLLQLALRKRQEADQVAMENRRSAAQLEQAKAIEKIREEGETLRAKAANDAVLSRMNAEYKLRSEADQEKERRAMVERANEVLDTGKKLPKDATYEVASEALVEARGKSYIEANKRMGVAMSGLLRHTGADPQQLASRVANMVADDPSVAKALTVDEREAIRNNPTKLNEFRAKFAAQKPWWGKNEKYEAFNAALQQAGTTVTGELEKEAASKPEAVRAAADLRQASDLLQTFNKNFSVSPQIQQAAFEAYSNAAAPPTAAPAAAAPRPRPPLPPPIGGPVAPTVAPGQMQAVPITPDQQSQLFNQPSPDDQLFSRSISLSNQMRPQAAPVAINPTPGVPADPATLARLRAQKFLQDSAARNSSLFPTAYPVSPDLLQPSAH